MIFWGYFTILLAVTLLIVLTEKVFSKFMCQEYCRKILHIGTVVALPLANVFLGKGSIHFVVICAVFSVVSLLLYLSNKLRTVDKREKRYPGIFYYALSLLTLAVVCYFFPNLSNYFGIAFLALALGDGCATLMGYTFRGVKIYKDKTLVGFVSCFVATFVATALYCELNQMSFQVYHFVVLAMLVAIVELVDWGLDNVAIPLVLFFASYWVAVSPTALMALVVFETVFLIVFLGRVISYYGSLVAAGMGLLFYYFGGLYSLLFVVGCYVVMLLVSLVSKLLKNDVSGVVKKTGKKDFVEIFVNGVWAMISMVLYAVFESQVFFVMALMCISQGFVDSLASDVGTLSKKQPYDIFRNKRVPKGLSGGVTLLGSVASLLGAVVFALAIKLVCNLSYPLVALVAATIYMGSVVDSILGSMVQVKYRCTKCNALTEKEVHCNENTVVESGCRWINNDVVNLLSGMFVFAAAFILFVFM